MLSDIGFGKLVILSTHIVSDIESIATHIAIMNRGMLVAMGTPEELLRGTEGNVWELVVPSEQFETMRRQLRVSSVVRKPDGVHVRVVAPEAPMRGAVAVEPSLEDAFLFTMRGEQAA